jgi:hypothetical protein
MNPPYALWSIWNGFGLLQRLFMELLLAIAAYCLFVSFRTALRLHTIEKQNVNGRVISIEGVLAPLYRSLANTRQVIGATFYVFGFVLFLNLQFVQNTLGARSAAGELKQILGGFMMCCAFGANVFFILLLLHIAQWLVSIMLNRCSKRLNNGSHRREEKMEAVST